MKRRGRPPHPDVLTDREWEVYYLVRMGQTNQEIADWLGISFAGAKFHVSEIITKLGLERRAGLRALELEPRSVRVRRLNPVIPPPSTAGHAAVRRGFAAVGVAGAVGLLALLALSAMLGGDRYAYLLPAVAVLTLVSASFAVIVAERVRHHLTA